MERMTVEQRDGLFCGVVQSLRGSTWKTVVVLKETASPSQFLASRQTSVKAAELGCAYMAPVSVKLELVA